MGKIAQALVMGPNNAANEPSELGSDRSIDFPRDDISGALVQHEPVLLATARLLLRNENDARDLVQATYELALRHGSALRDTDRLLGWLIRIETREAYRLRRRLRHLVQRPMPESVDQSTVEGDTQPLREALSHLPRRERTAIVLHHMVGLPVAETADAMGVSTNTVKSQLKSGLARLREAMK